MHKVSFALKAIVSYQSELLKETRLTNKKLEELISYSRELHKLKDYQIRKEYNDSYNVHGNNWIAQSFTATSTTVSKISLYLDKVIGASLSLYDNFNDATRDTSKWNYIDDVNGTAVEESGGETILYPTASNGTNQHNQINSDGKTKGDPIKGAKWDQWWVGYAASDLSIDEEQWNNILDNIVKEVQSARSKS